MDIQEILIVILVALAFLLSVLLFHRIRNERRRAAAIKKMSLSDFSEFLLTNSVDGTIGEVARKVSDLLQKSIGCDRIVFLRKKRNYLELNYYHGIRRFNRSDFRLEYSDHLMKTLVSDYLPRPLEKLRPVLPKAYYEMLIRMELREFFPIFWRSNLYGIYFVRSTMETDVAAVNLLIASLAQSLSAAYHVKWHESRNEFLQKRLQESKGSTPAVVKDSERVVESHLLKLVKHRSPETIIPKVIRSLKKDLGINRIVYIWQKKGKESQPIEVVQDGVNGGIQVPQTLHLDKLLKRIGTSKLYAVDNLPEANNTTKSLAKLFQNSGLSYLSAFSLAEDRPGLLVWGSNRDPLVLHRQLEQLHGPAADLVENAEMFEQIEEMSYTDSLTGLANQRYFHRRLEEEIQRAKRYKRVLSLIIFDLDQLKQINDLHGHLAGDMALQQVGEILRKSIRTIDIIARYGGDEFCIIMPEADTNTCRRFMERLRVDMNRARITIENVPEPLSFTVSLGGAVFPTHADNAKQLIYAADMALLKAKEKGRNTSWLFDGSLQTAE